MTAVMSRCAALLLFLLWNFHAGMHAWHEHDHEDDVEHGAILVAEHDEDCGSCHLSVAPGLLGHEPVLHGLEEQTFAASMTPLELASRLFTIADGRGPPLVVA